MPVVPNLCWSHNLLHIPVPCVYHLANEATSSFMELLLRLST